MWRVLWRYRLLLGCVLATYALHERLVSNMGGLWQ